MYKRGEKHSDRLHLKGHMIQKEMQSGLYKSHTKARRNLQEQAMQNAGKTNVIRVNNTTM